MMFLLFVTLCCLNLQISVSIRQTKVAELLTTPRTSLTTHLPTCTSSLNPPTNQRWVPPKAREQLTPNEIAFRRIRGILNKLTPDNFDKLSNELTQYISSNDRDILKGAILLVFDKAVDEANYSYMYGQLCLRLNDSAPNFEDSSSKTTTFRRLLLQKCREEFENRARATAAFDSHDGLTADEEEQRNVAKRKMLGNVKFIGELFKLGMLHEAIVHQCIKELLEKKRRSMDDMCENVECVCSILITVGGKLDTTKAKNWMDKYFQRMEDLLQTIEFPPRIRFMLMDTIELRNNQWTPRKSKSEDGPKPLERNPPLLYRPHPPPAVKSYIFTSPLNKGTYHHTPSLQDKSVSDDKRDISFDVNVKKLPSGKKSGSNVSLRPSMTSRKFQHQGLKLSSDVAPPNTGAPETSGRSQPIPRTRDDSSDEEDNMPTSMRPILPLKMASQGPPRPPIGAYVGPPPHYHPLMRPHPPQMARGQPLPGHMMPLAPPTHYPLPLPRPYYGPPPLSAPPSRPYYGPLPLGPPPPPHDWPHPLPHLYPPSLAPPINMPSPPHIANNEVILKERNEIPLVKKTTKKVGGAQTKKEPKPSREEMMINPVLMTYLSTHDIPGAVSSITTISEDIPADIITTTLINKTLSHSEDDRCLVSLLITELYKQEVITAKLFIKGSHQVLINLGKSDTTLSRNAISGYLARAISEGVASLKETMVLFKDGSHHPVALIVLQALVNLIGQDGVKFKVKVNKFIITDVLPTSEKPYSTACKLLEKRNLGFLYPLKQIHNDLKLLLKQSEVSAVGVYKWIKGNVDAVFFQNTEFIMLLTKCLLGHVTKDSHDNPSKDNISNEKKIMLEYKLVIQKFVMDNTILQMAVVYATQVFCNDLGFPKGLLLRLFSYWYDMDVVEEEVLMKWREDPSDHYPGKGKALFQVNQWLVLLAEAEEEFD